MRHRKDDNHHELVQFAESLGVYWIEEGPFDGWALWRGIYMPVEIKRPDKEGWKHEYTPKQRRLLTETLNRSAKVWIWRHKEDVLRDIGARVSA